METAAARRAADLVNGGENTYSGSLLRGVLSLRSDTGGGRGGRTGDMTFPGENRYLRSSESNIDDFFGGGVGMTFVKEDHPLFNSFSSPISSIGRGTMVAEGVRMSSEEDEDFSLPLSESRRSGG